MNRPEPGTEAGKTMMREHTSGSPHMIRHVLAIEAEARASAFAEIQREHDNGWHIGEVLRRRGITARIPKAESPDD